MKPLIQAAGIVRAFDTAGGKVTALDHVTLSVEQGKLTVLRGRSGSGKTTLLNILGALDRPTQGSVLFDGQEITALGDTARDDLRRRKIGFVFQSVALMSMMSAYENVEFGLRIAGVPAGERRERAMECLKQMGLEKRAGHMPSQLSGGEQQRVAIARAIAHRPQVIFADEPTAELDTATGLQVVKLFREMIEREGVTVLMTTHDPGMVEVADLVYTLSDGRLAPEETPKG